MPQEQPEQQVVVVLPRGYRTSREPDGTLRVRMSRGEFCFVRWEWRVRPNVLEVWEPRSFSHRVHRYTDATLYIFHGRIEELPLRDYNWELLLFDKRGNHLCTLIGDLGKTTAVRPGRCLEHVRKIGRLLSDHTGWRLRYPPELQQEQMAGGVPAPLLLPSTPEKHPQRFSAPQWGPPLIWILGAILLAAEFGPFGARSTAPGFGLWFVLLWMSWATGHHESSVVLDDDGIALEKLPGVVESLVAPLVPNKWKRWQRVWQINWSDLRGWRVEDKGVTGQDEEGDDYERHRRTLLLFSRKPGENRQVDYDQLPKTSFNRLIAELKQRGVAALPSPH